jgi:hypothetical protein
LADYNFLYSVKTPKKVLAEFQIQYTTTPAESKVKAGGVVLVENRFLLLLF